MGSGSGGGTKSSTQSEAKTQLLAKNHDRSDLDGQVFYHTGPSYSTNALGKIGITPVIPLTIKGATTSLEHEHLWRLKKTSSTKYSWRKFKKYWFEQRKQDRPSLFRAISSAFGLKFALSVLLMCVNCASMTSPYEIFHPYFAQSMDQAAAQFALPVLMPYLVTWFEYNTILPVWWVFVYIIAIFVSNIAASLFNYHSQLVLWKWAVNVRGSLCSLIYEKSLYTIVGRSQSIGMITNLMASDAHIVMDGLPSFVLGIVAPLQIAVVIGMLSTLVHIYCLIPLAVSLVAIPVSFILSINIADSRLKLLKKSDNRLKLIQELFNAIRIIKYYAWERIFIHNISLARQKQLRSVSTFLLSRAFLNSLLSSVPILATGLTFIFYSLGNNVDLSTVFSAVTYLNMLRVPFMYLPLGLALLAQYLASIRRLTFFLMRAELEPLHVEPNFVQGDAALRIAGGSFAWETDLTVAEDRYVELETRRTRYAAALEYAINSNDIRAIKQQMKTIDKALKVLEAEIVKRQVPSKGKNSRYRSMSPSGSTEVVAVGPAPGSTTMPRPAAYGGADDSASRSRTITVPARGSKRNLMTSASNSEGKSPQAPSILPALALDKAKVESLSSSSTDDSGEEKRSHPSKTKPRSHTLAHLPQASTPTTASVLQSSQFREIMSIDLDNIKRKKSHDKTNISKSSSLTRAAGAAFATKSIRNVPITPREGIARSMTTRKMEREDTAIEEDRHRPELSSESDNSSSDESNSSDDSDVDLANLFPLRPPSNNLVDIDFTVRKGKLTMVVGNVGSGKSTLAMAFLGEVTRVAGHLWVTSEISYASQTPWIFNATIRENITFGQPFDREWYTRVVESCCLPNDFALMPAADMTEVGEGGSNLSGGQKQRVNIARAMYAKREIMILDDPFSALDPHVCHHIFEHVPLALRNEGKTVLLITNSLHLLHHADYVGVLRNGRLVEQGAYPILMRRRGILSKMMAQFEAKVERDALHTGMVTTKHSVQSLKPSGSVASFIIPTRHSSRQLIPETPLGNQSANKTSTGTSTNAAISNPSTSPVEIQSAAPAATKDEIGDNNDQLHRSPSKPRRISSKLPLKGGTGSTPTVLTNPKISGLKKMHRPKRKGSRQNRKGSEKSLEDVDAKDSLDSSLAGSSADSFASSPVEGLTDLAAPRHPRRDSRLKTAVTTYSLLPTLEELHAEQEARAKNVRFITASGESGTTPSEESPHIPSPVTKSSKPEKDSSTNKTAESSPPTTSTPTDVHPRRNSNPTLPTSSNATGSIPMTTVPEKLGKVAKSASSEWIGYPSRQTGVSFASSPSSSTTINKSSDNIPISFSNPELTIPTYPQLRSSKSERGLNSTEVRKQREAIAAAEMRLKATSPTASPTHGSPAHTREIEEIPVPSDSIIQVREVSTKNINVTLDMIGKVLRQRTRGNSISGGPVPFDPLPDNNMMVDVDREEADRIKEMLAGEEGVKFETSDEIDEQNRIKGAMIGFELRQKGNISASTYWQYMKAGGIWLLLLACVSQIIRSGSRVMNGVWLSWWSDKSNPQNLSQHTYLGVYVGWVVAECIFAMISSFFVLFFSLRASPKLHSNLVTSITTARINWFDSTPLGRIIARFARDIENIDIILPQSVDSTLTTFFALIGTVLSVATGTPYIFLIVGVGMIAFFFITWHYRKTSIQLQRLEAAHRAPIFSHFASTLNGAVTIRAFNMADKFKVANMNKIDNHTVDYLGLRVSNLWFGITLDMIANIFVLISFVAIVLVRIYASTSIAVGLMIFALSTTGGVTSSLASFSNAANDLENKMNSPDRVFDYLNLPREGAYEVAETEPDVEWPEEGGIVVKDLTIEYIPGAPVLKNMKFRVKPREKIGIVGRTGAGKSTLISAIFRAVEPLTGTIKIDGIDISTIGLFDLRSRVGIIPQTPQLFNGSIRFNLDPFSFHHDDDLWFVLDRVKLADHVRKLSGQLYHTIDEGSSAFSLGQRQLLSLARCLLRNTSILLLDEATASLDIETDAILQRIIREHFNDKTVITIAHRLNTIMDSDRIMVLEAGEIAELGTPAKLLSNLDGILSQMVDATGPENSQYLRAIASGAVSPIEVFEKAASDIKQAESSGPRYIARRRAYTTINVVEKAPEVGMGPLNVDINN